MVDDNALNEQEGSAVTLQDISDKLDQLISLLTESSDNGEEVEAAKAEGAPEGTMDAGSGEGAEKKLPKDVAEKTQESNAGESAPEKVKLEKAMNELHKEVASIKKAVLSITKSTTSRPSISSDDGDDDDDNIRALIKKAIKGDDQWILEELR